MATSHVSLQRIISGVRLKRMKEKKVSLPSDRQIDKAIFRWNTSNLMSRCDSHHMKRKQIYLKHWAVLENIPGKDFCNNDLSWKGFRHVVLTSSSSGSWGTTSAHVASTCRQSQGLHSWFNYWLSGLTTRWQYISTWAEGIRGEHTSQGFLCSASGVLGWLTSWEIMYLN